MTVAPSEALRVIDTHTAGEPTRVVLSGVPDLGSGPLAVRRGRLERDAAAWRSAVVREPRGHDAVVGAALVPPLDPASAAAVVFFNNVGTLGMCGHGVIGLVEALRHVGALTPGSHVVETPVGPVRARLHADRSVSVANVPSHRSLAGLELDVPGVGRVRGDVAWGGNWFFLVDGSRPDLSPDHLPRLVAETTAIRRALAAAGVRGDDGAEVDHIELFGPLRGAGRTVAGRSGRASGARSFVLCPGHAYDRSPCGTGTSAKLACLHADGRLAAGEVWTQESVVGSSFEAVIERAEGGVVWPVISGRAFVTAEATLHIDPDDAFGWGIP